LAAGGSGKDDGISHQAARRRFRQSGRRLCRYRRPSKKRKGLRSQVTLFPARDPMRLDLFLKWSRVILRRTLAKDTCDAGRVTVNGQEARAGREVHVGDTISVQLPRRRLTFRVRSIPPHAPGKEGAHEMIELTE